MEGKKGVILGISALYHDSSAALLIDGRLVGAAQEERFTRNKFESGFPIQAINWVLRDQGLSPADIDCVAFYERPWRKRDRFLETHRRMAPWGWNQFRRLGGNVLGRNRFRRELSRLLPSYQGEIEFFEHHRCHAACSFHLSPFEEAAVLVVDGVGEWATTSVWTGGLEGVKSIAWIGFPHSLGLLYAAFTRYLGLRVNQDEFKLMGLAAYSQADVAEAHAATIFEKLVDVRSDGSFRLNMDFFDFAGGMTMTSPRFHNLFGAPPRPIGSVPQQREMDLAGAIQRVAEEVMLGLCRFARTETRLERLCLGGGVALNSVANGVILRSGLFGDYHFPPAPGDAGGAVGAAILAHLERTPRGGGIDPGDWPLVGPAFCEEAIESVTAARPEERIRFETEDELATATAELIASGKVVGWFQGAMEFGPRALGSRSILADPRHPSMQSILNQKVKFRESYRPFAAVVAEEEVGQYFAHESPSPYMMIVSAIRDDHRVPLSEADRARTGLGLLALKRSNFPAVTHVDFSVRIQTVPKRHPTGLARLLRSFGELTGDPVLINTSLNLRDEPIACTPEDALGCYDKSHIDALVLGQTLLHRSGPRQPAPARSKQRTETHVMAEANWSGGDLWLRIYLALLYFIWITPSGLIGRLVVRNAFQPDETLDSYWRRNQEGEGYPP